MLCRTLRMDFAAILRMMGEAEIGEKENGNSERISAGKDDCHRANPMPRIQTADMQIVTILYPAKLLSLWESKA